MEKLEYLPNGQLQLSKSDKPTSIGEHKDKKLKEKTKAIGDDIQSQLDDAMKFGVEPAKPDLNLVLSKPKTNLSIVKD